MALYRYLKEEPKPVKTNKEKIKSKKGFSFIFLILGLILVGNATIPIISYQFRYAPKFGKMLSPLVYERKEVLGSITALAQEEQHDYTLISSWFDDVINRQADYSSQVEFYNLSIPKLGIENAVVHLGGEDLKKILIHYPETALPGRMGNAVIFGHSVLPQFFDPKNYLTIFSTLYQLKEGDDIFIDFDGVTYRYLIEDLFEVSPKDLSVLEQRHDDRYLTLITCCPPGTYLRRCIVKGRLVANDFIGN